MRHLTNSNQERNINVVIYAFPLPICMFYNEKISGTGLAENPDQPDPEREAKAEAVHGEGDGHEFLEEGVGAEARGFGVGIALFEPPFEPDAEEDAVIEPGDGPAPEMEVLDLKALGRHQLAETLAGVSALMAGPFVLNPPQRRVGRDGEDEDSARP